MTEDTVSEITYTNNITVEEYNKLRKSVDWILVTEKRAAIALGNTFYLCVAMVGEEPVNVTPKPNFVGTMKGSLLFDTSVSCRLIAFKDGLLFQMIN